MYGLRLVVVGIKLVPGFNFFSVVSCTPMVHLLRFMRLHHSCHGLVDLMPPDAAICYQLL